MTAASLLVIDGGRRSPPPLVPRAALGPWQQPKNYALPAPRAYVRDLRYYRGNFSGLHFGDAPIVPGCNEAHPELVMACLLDNYPPAFQDRYLLAYAQSGYTHLQRSIGHSLFYGGTVASHIALSQRAQSYGLWCDEWFMGGGEGDGWAFKARDQTLDYWAPLLQPIIADLLNAGVVDTACIGWQLDQFNIPGNVLIAIIAWIADMLPQAAPVYTHWVNEAMAWWKTGGEVWTDRTGSRDVHDRFTWWLAMQPYLTGAHHQGDTHMARTDLKLYQDHMRDTTEPFADGRMGASQRDGVRPFVLDAFESTAQEQFDGSCGELEGDQIGYVLTAVATGGYGNGARQPDGTAW